MTDRITWDGTNWSSPWPLTEEGLDNLIDEHLRKVITDHRRIRAATTAPACTPLPWTGGIEHRP